MKKAIWVFFILPLFAGCYFEERVPVEMVSMDESRPLGTEKSLDSTIHFDIGSLEISAEEKPGPLYSLDLWYDKASYRPDVEYHSTPVGGEGRFSFSLDTTHRMGIRRESHTR